MIFVERHFTKGNKEIIRLCGLSKDLYNRCNYLLRKSWFSQKHLKFRKLPDINYLVKEVEKLDCFTKFNNTKIPKQIIRKCLTDWYIFKNALKAFGKNPKNFDYHCPKPPKYKKKLTQIIFYNETIKGGKSKNKILPNLTANNNCFSVRFKENYKRVIITPKSFGFMIEVEYEIQENATIKPKLDKEKVCTIDVGINNLCAITLDQNRPILINGRILKSINQYYNKYPNKHNLKKRYFRIENYFHHVSKLIVSLCVKYKIGKIIIGKNNGWKTKINLGKKTNQNFCSISFINLFQKIQYKADLVGIEVVFTEESYTSKASFYDNDPLPQFQQGKTHEFSGKRVKRGLYLTKDKFALNADINASLNIGRKVIPEFLGIRDRSLAARPVRINPLRKSRGEDEMANSSN